MVGVSLLMWAFGMMLFFGVRARLCCGMCCGPVWVVWARWNEGLKVTKPGRVMVVKRPSGYGRSAF